MARIAKPTVPQKAYRHFAVVTVVVALLLALFANGESRQAVAEEMAQRDEQARLERISAERARGPRITRREEASQARFDGGDLEDFGKPMERLQSGGAGNTSINPYATGATRSGESVVIPGYSRAYLDSLTEEQYQQLLRNTRDAGLLSADEREANLANLSQGSERRSGQATPSEQLVN